MDLLRKAKDRAQQSMSEKVGSAQKTDYDPEFQAMLDKADAIKNHQERMLAAIEHYIQPDPTAKMLTGVIPEGPTRCEKVGAQLGAYGEKLKSWDNASSGKLEAGAKAFEEIGQAERQMIETITEKYVTAVKNFLSADWKNFDTERKKLGTLRLDMDTLKSKVAKAQKEDPALKTKLENAEKEFDEQQKKVKEMIEEMQEKRLPELQAFVKSYIEAHQQFHKKAAEVLDDLKDKF